MENLKNKFGIMTSKTSGGYKETVFLTKSEEWKQAGEFEIIEAMAFDSEKAAFDFLTSKDWDKPEPFKLSELL